MVFNRKEFMRERHVMARKQRTFYKKEYGGLSGTSYSDFLKNDSPITRNIVVYDVSFQLNYRGEIDDFKIPKKTFKVVAFENDSHEIYNKTMNMVLDMKGKNSKSHLAVGTNTMIKDNIDIKVNPRGMERSSRKITREEILKVLETGSSISQIDRDLKFTNKKKRDGHLKLDLRHF